MWTLHCLSSRFLLRQETHPSLPSPPGAQVKAGLAPWAPAPLPEHHTRSSLKWERAQPGPSCSLGHSLGASRAEGMLT